MFFDVLAHLPVLFHYYLALCKAFIELPPSSLFVVRSAYPPHNFADRRDHKVHKVQQEQPRVDHTGEEEYLE